MSTFNSEIRGLYNFYRIAENVGALHKYYYMVRYSMLKTLAGKHRTNVSVIKKRHMVNGVLRMNFPLIYKRRRLVFVLSRLALKLWSKPRILAHLLHWTLNRLPLTKSLCLQARKVRIMSNILKATRLDFSLVKPYVKVIGFTMLLPIAFAAINRSILTGVSFAMCFIAMTTGYTFSVTEKNSMERLYGILPVKKSEMVMGRYLFVVVLGVIALVVSLITHPIVLRALGETVEPFDIISAAIGGLFLFALYTVFQIPGYYKFGSIKGRVFMYIPVAGFLVTLFLLPKLPADNPIINAIASSPILLLALAITLVVVMYAVSIWFSVQIMKNKEM